MLGVTLVLAAACGADENADAGRIAASETPAAHQNDETGDAGGTGDGTSAASIDVTTPSVASDSGSDSVSSEAIVETNGTGVPTETSVEPTDPLEAEPGKDVQGAVCSDDSCTCEAGFRYFPDIEPARCLRWCDMIESLDNDADVAKLAARGCEVLEGGLVVSNMSYATSLAGLETIRYIHGDVMIVHTVLRDLAGLSGLERYSGGLVIALNDLLTELGLTQLQHAGQGDIAVQGNPLLTTLRDLDGVQFPKISLYIENNESLVNLDGLSTLSDAVEISVTKNAALVDIDALGSLFSAESLTLSENQSLTTATIGALNDVGTLAVADNPALESLVAPSLVSADTVSVQNNALLKAVTMPAIASAAFSFTDNPALPQCEVDAISGGACTNCTGNDESVSCQ